MKKGRRLWEIEEEMERNKRLAEAYMRQVAAEEALEDEANEVHDPMLDPWLPEQES